MQQQVPLPTNIRGIRTIPSKAKLYTNTTLVWLKDQDIGIKTLSRWDGIVVGIQDFRKWKQAGITPRFFIAMEEGDIDLGSLDELKDTLCFFSGKIFDIIPPNIMRGFINNFIGISDIIQPYPFIIHSWNGTVEDAIAIIATVLRHKVVAGVDEASVSDERKAVLKSLKMSISKYSIPPQCVFVTQYYKPPVPRRAREIRKCLKENCANAYIDKILLLNEEDFSKEWSAGTNYIPGSEKIEQKIIGKRIKYSDFLTTVLEEIPENTYVILANADIYCDDSISQLWGVSLKDTMMALLRWDIQADQEKPAVLFGPRADSQDTWIVLSDSVKSKTWNMENFAYELGKGGCDNRFTFDMFKMRFAIVNPAQSIKTMHLHVSDVRTWKNEAPVPSDAYLIIEPSQIFDTNHNANALPVCDKLELSPFNIHIRSNDDDHGITYCKMLGRHNRFVWKANDAGANVVAPTLKLSKLENTFVNYVGLTYDLNNLYLGPSSTIGTYWGNVGINYLHPSTFVKKMFAIPFQNTEVFEKVEYYFLYYLGRVMHLLEKYPEFSFWIPQSLSSDLQFLNWGPENRVNGVGWEKNKHVWAKEVIGWTAPEKVDEVSSENIVQLRKMIGDNWKSEVNWDGGDGTSEKKTCLIAVDTTYFTDEFVQLVRETLGDGWNVVTLSATSSYTEQYINMIGKHMFIFFGGAKSSGRWGATWALPQNAVVLEFENELKIDGEFQHVAGACGLDSWILTLHKNPPADMRTQAVGLIQQWFAKNPLKA